MKTLIIKLKYYIYGGIFGIVLISIYQAIRLVAASINVHESLSWAVIGIIALFLIFLLRFLWLKQSTWKKWKDCRYFQKKNYDVLFLAGGICPFVFFAAGFFSNMNQDNTFIKCIVFTILLGSTAYLATVKKKIPYSMKKANIKKKKLSPDREIINFRDDAFFEKQEQEFVKDFDKYTGACVFGIEGPWGVGKTSFASLCCKRLKGIHKDNIVIYKFNPLNYEDTNKVLKNFCSGLIAKIQEKHFEPELEALLTSYMDKIIAVVSNPSFFNIQFKFPDTPCSEDAIVKKLETELEKISYQIVVVIDDLDRLDFLTIKKIFFLMRNIFCFDKLKFIVCYDLENVIWSAKVNLNSDSTDEEKIIEFVDKYINETCPLYFRPDKIRDYIPKLATKYMELQPVKSTLWDNSIDAILNICVGKDFFSYQKFFGTPRRIKKILQQLLRVSYAVSDVDTAFDFTGIDLVNLLLIYLYYPRCFKKLYYTETGAQRGIYSCMEVASITDHKVQDEKIESVENIIENSKEYPESAAFLFKRLFANKDIFRHITHEQFYQRACFNRPTFFSSMGTLEKYLRLIVFSEALEKNEIYSTYRNIICNEICTAENEGTLQAVFKKYQDIQRTLWGAIGDSMQIDLAAIYSVPLLQWLINFAMTQLPEYKLTSDIISFHTKLIVYIKIFLDELAKRTENPSVNENSVLHQLLYQNLDDYSPLMNIFDALYLKEAIKPKQSPMDTNTEELEKSESLDPFQSIYQAFRANFQNRNLWQEFNYLPLEKMFEFPSDIPKNQLDVKRKIALFKFKSFILHHIGSIKEGLASYDLSDIGDGNGDFSGICHEFSEYLRGQCFDIGKFNDDACFNFMEFMLISIIDNSECMLTIRNLNANNNVQSTTPPESLVNLMYPPILKSYWRTNRDTIMKSSVFCGRSFYINEDTIVDARLVADYIGHSLDYWTSDEQAARWRNLYEILKNKRLLNELY